MDSWQILGFCFWVVLVTHSHTEVQTSTVLYLLVRVHVDVALDTFLSHVGPGVSAHPLPLALGALVLSEAALLALVRSETFTFGPSLQGHGREHVHVNIQSSS